MQFVLFLAVLVVAHAATLRGLDTVSASYSLSWASSESISTTWTAATLDKDSGKQLVASNTNSNTYVSKDFGVSYTLTSASLGLYSITSDTTGQFVAGGTQSSGVYISSDFGVSWTLSSCPTVGKFYALGSSLKAGTDGKSWVIVAVAANSGVYISKDSGSSWTSISPVTYSSGSTYGSGVGVDIHGQVIQVSYTSSSGATTVYYSGNFGSSWSSESLSYTLGPLSASTETGQFLIAGGVGAIYISSNYGNTWTAATAPSSSITYTYSAMSATGQLAAIVGGTQIYFSSDYGRTWTVTNAPNKTYTQLATNMVGDHWVTAADGGKIIVGRVRK